MSLITVFDPWESKLCTCPKKYSLSAYTGCGHGCLYCYASSYIRNFSAPRPKQDFLKRLEKELKKIPAGSLITMANSSDPYQPLEKQLRLTRKSLQILRNYDLKINLVTKSSLILRDLDIIKDFKKIVVSLSITTLDEKLAKRLEPGASNPQERLAALAKLSRNIVVVVRLDPLIYPLNTEEVEKIVKQIKSCGAKQVITSTYKAKPDNYKKMTAEFTEWKNYGNELYLKKGKKYNGYAYLSKQLRQKLIEQVREAVLKEGLEFSSCREGLASLNTANCDGSSFLN